MADLTRSCCSTVLALLVGSRCAGCTRPAATNPCAACRVCLLDAPPSEGAAFPDSGVAGRMVRAGKRGAWRGAGRELARLILQRVEQRRLVLPQVDAVTWVPADPRRRARRGGHLPHRIATHLAHELGVPALDLLRRRAGTTQRGLDRAARLSNVRHAFYATGSTRRAVATSRMRVLLIDDVRTTGATFDAASRALPAGVEQVACLAVLGVERWIAGNTDNLQKAAQSVEISLTLRGASADESGHDRRTSAFGRFPVFTTHATGMLVPSHETAKHETARSTE